MTQLVARIDDDLARGIDQLIAEGVVELQGDGAGSQSTVCPGCVRKTSVRMRPADVWLYRGQPGHR